MIDEDYKDLILLLRSFQGQYKEIARRSGLKVKWLSQFSQQNQKDYGIKKVQALRKVLLEMKSEFAEGVK